MTMNLGVIDVNVPTVPQYSQAEDADSLRFLSLSCLVAAVEKGLLIIQQCGAVVMQSGKEV